MKLRKVVVKLRKDATAKGWRAVILRTGVVILRMGVVILRMGVEAWGTGVAALKTGGVTMGEGWRMAREGMAEVLGLEGGRGIGRGRALRLQRYEFFIYWPRAAGRFFCVFFLKGD